MKFVQVFLNLFFLAGAIILLLFVILAGSTDTFPFNRFYWVRANTSGISGASSESAWTFWGVCEYQNFSNCKLGPAYPISPVDNFGTTSGVAKDFINNQDTYYFLSRFGFAFAIITLCFVGFSFILELVGLVHSVVDKIVALLVGIAFLFVSAFAAVQTAVVVLARNAFNTTSLSPHIGVKMLAITWAAFAVILILFVNSVAGAITTSYQKYLHEVNGGQQSDHRGVANDQSSFTRSAPAEAKEDPNLGGIRFFKIKRNHKVSDDESV